MLTAGMLTLYGNADANGTVKAVSDTIGDMNSGLVIAQNKGVSYTIVCNDYSSGATDEYEAAKALQSAFSTLLGGSSQRIFKQCNEQPHKGDSCRHRYCP